MGFEKEVLVGKLKVKAKCFTDVRSARSYLESDFKKQFEFWYHGTNSSAANNIAEVGIQLERGLAGKDFSDGCGFYLSDQVKPACRWSMKRFTNKPSKAILQFKVPKLFLASKKDGVDLCQKYDKGMKIWREIVRFHRSQGHDAMNMKLVLRRSSYIIGPLSNDGCWHIHKSDPNWPKLLNTSWNQLCLRNNEIADQFDRFLYKIAFVEKQ